MSRQPRSAAALLFFIGQAINFVISFMATPYLARSLSQHDFGTYGQVLLVLDAVTVLFNLGLNNSMALSLTEPNKEREASIFSTFFALFGLVGLAGGLAIGLFSYFSHYLFGHSDADPLLRLIAIFFVFVQLNYAATRGLLYLDRSRYFVLASVLTTIVRVGSMFIAIHYYQSLQLAILGICLALVFHLLICMYYLPRFFFSGKIKTNTFIPILREGWLLGFNYQLQFSHLYLTGILVSYLLGVEQYAVYRSASFELPIVSTLYSAIATVMFPSLATQIQQGHHEQVLLFKQRVIGQVAALIYPIVIFMVVFSSCMIQLYLSEKYATGTPVFAIMSLLLLTKVTDFAEIMTMEKAYQAILKINIAYFILFLALALLLITFLGIVGAAISVVASGYFVCFLYLRQTLKPVGWSYNQLLNFRHLLTVIAVCTLLALAFRWVIGYWGCSLLSLLGCAILYSIIIYSIAFRYQWIDLPLYEPIFNQTSATRWLYRHLDRLFRQND